MLFATILPLCEPATTNRKGGLSTSWSGFALINKPRRLVIHLELAVNIRVFTRRSSDRLLLKGVEPKV